MVRKITLRQAGGSITATIPKDLAERHHLLVGEEVFAVETSEGVLFTAYDPTFDRTMRIFERGARKYRNALRALAK
jgi:putative addiction module antidote